MKKIKIIDVEFEACIGSRTIFLKSKDNSTFVSVNLYSYMDLSEKKLLLKFNEILNEISSDTKIMFIFDRGLKTKIKNMIKLWKGDY